MILVDSSIWMDHFRRPEAELVAALEQELVIMHPFVLGEIALGFMRARDQVIRDLADLPQMVLADDGEVLALINSRHLYGTGIGYVNVNLLASLKMMPAVRLWTRDKKFGEAAARLKISLYR